MVRFLESQVNKFCDILNSMTEASGDFKSADFVIFCEFSYVSRFCDIL